MLGALMSLDSAGSRTPASSESALTVAVGELSSAERLAALTAVELVVAAVWRVSGRRSSLSV